MSIVKPTEKGQDQRKEHLKELRSRRDKISRLASLKDAPEWNDYRSIINEFIDVEKRRYEYTVQSSRSHFRKAVIDGIEQIVPVMPEHIISDLNCSKAIQETYGVLLSVVEDTDEKLSQIDLEIKKYERAYKEAAEILR